MSKKLNRFLKNLPQSKTSTQGTDKGLVDDLFGISRSPAHGDGDHQLDANGNLNHGRTSSKEKKKKKPGMNDVPDKVLLGICEYLKEGHLKNIRLVSKRFNLIGTDVFLTIHSPILINTEDRVFNFNNDLGRSFKFPFSKFILVLHPIKRHLLITFIRAYDTYIQTLSLEPFDNGHIKEADDLPQQHLLFKLTGILGELRAVEHLNIRFPAMCSLDYFDLEFNINFDLEKLKILSIKFASSGFCKFSADLTLEILKKTVELKKLWLKLPEPCNGHHESRELRRVLTDQAAQNVPAISLTLSVETNDNGLIPMLIDIVACGLNSRITSFIFNFGKWVSHFKNVLKLIRATRGFLHSLRLFRRLGRDGEGCSFPPLYLPSLPALRFLEVESHKLPVMPLNKDQFPALIGCVLHLQYGTEKFYLHSMLHPLTRLKLNFHGTSILRRLIPEMVMPSLFSCHLTKLELVNPPPEHLTFMGHWAEKIETLIISIPVIYEGDPTFPIDKVLAQLQGRIQLRDYYPTHLMLMPKLAKLHLLFPIDESMALYLSRLSKLWQLVVDDLKVSGSGIHAMKYQHLTYISWKYEPPARTYE